MAKILIMEGIGCRMQVGWGAFSLSTYLRIRYLKKVGLGVATTR